MYHLKRSFNKANGRDHQNESKLDKNWSVGMLEYGNNGFWDNAMLD